MSGCLLEEAWVSPRFNKRGLFIWTMCFYFLIR